MSDVQFEDNGPIMPNSFAANQGLVGWMVKQGFAKDGADANKKLLVVGLLALLGTFLVPYFFIYRNATTTTPVITEEGVMPPQPTE